MSVQENKAVVKRLFEEVWNEGKLAAIEELISPDYVGHDPFTPEGLYGAEGYTQYIAQFRTAFPDVHLTIDTQIGEGDLVATRWSARGTFTGPFKGVTPTYKPGEVTGITITRFAAGKIVEGWMQRDDLHMLQTMGVVPELTAA